MIFDLAFIESEKIPCLLDSPLSISVVTVKLDVIQQCILDSKYLIRVKISINH